MANEGPSDGAPPPVEAAKPDDRGREPAAGRSSQTEQSGQSGQSTEAGADQQPGLPNAETVFRWAQPYIAAQRATGVRHDGDVYGGESYGFVHTVNKTIVVPSASGKRIAPSTVPPQLLEKVRAVVVPPRIAEHAMRVLGEQRVLILQGRCHWGKATLALWLLSRIGGHDAGPPPKVCAITPEVRLGDLPEGFFAAEERASDRYVVDTLSCEVAKALHLPVLRALCDQLGNGYLVITVDSWTPIPRIELHDYLVSCEELSESGAVLRENLRWRLDGQEPPNHLFALEWVEQVLKRAPLPGHLDQLAEVLAAVVQKRIDEVDAKDEYARWVRLRVEEWFESHPDVPERCCMVAAAVLNGASYHDVADAAEKLRTLWDKPKDEEEKKRKKKRKKEKKKNEEGEDDDEGKQGEPSRPPDWTLSSPRRHVAEGIGARIVPTSVSTELGPTPSEVLVLEDGDLQGEVLEHIWSEHSVVRSTVLEWLGVLGCHIDLDVSGRAAAAVGALCRKDFFYLYHRLLLGWATAPELNARVSAAIALDVVAREHQLAQPVQELLHLWISDDPRSPLAWTATATYGFGVGVRWPTRALRDLRDVVEKAPYHAWVASRSLANLCQAGKASTVLDAITAWAAVDDPPDAAERALHVFLEMLKAGSDMDILSRGSDGQHERVPTLLSLAAEEEQVRIRVAALWKQAFQRAQTHEKAVKVLNHWITLADERRAALQALDAVAPELLMGTSSEQEDLADVLRKRATNRRRPSPNARRYLQSIGQEVAC